MPSPVLIVGGVIIAVGAGFAFKQFVYDPYLAPQLQDFIAELHEQRDQRHRQLVEPHLDFPPRRGKSASVDSFNEKRRPNEDGLNDAGTSTGTEMREVPAGTLRHRGAPFERNQSEVEMGAIGDSFPLTTFDSPGSTSQQHAGLAARQPSIAGQPPMPSPPVTRSTPTNSPRQAPATPRSPFSDLHALSEISFSAHSSSDPFEDYQRLPPSMQSPPAAAAFSPFVLPQSPPNIADPFVDVPARVQSPYVEIPRSERPVSPWTELSVHSEAGATSGQQLHHRLSRTDTDSEKDGSESGSDGSWEHT